MDYERCGSVDLCVKVMQRRYTLDPYWAKVWGYAIEVR